MICGVMRDDNANRIHRDGNLSLGETNSMIPLFFFNEKFISAMMLMVITAVGTSVYYLATLLWDEVISPLFTVEISLDSKCQAFEWIVRWIAKQNANNRIFNLQKFTVHLIKRTTAMTDDLQDNDGMMESENDMKIELLPGFGTHIFFYQGRICWFSRSESASETRNHSMRRKRIFEEISLCTYGRDPKIFEDLMREARNMCMKNDFDKTIIYVLDDMQEWIIGSYKRRRDFDSIILEDEKMETLIYEDASRFLKDCDYYVKLGIPYRRGYLLFGPPGCGKTSFVTALASRLSLNIALVTLSNPELDDESLNECLHSVPPNSIILLEEIDSIFVNRDIEDDISNCITFSGLLNALDGAASQEGKLLFMTTNHIEKLDAALIRPGRCDLKCHFRLANRRQLYKVFCRFFPDHDKLAQQFSHCIPQYTVSMASIQEFLVRHKNDPIAALENYHDLLNDGRICPQRMASNNPLAIDDEMAMWLRRFGLAHYTKHLHDNGLHRVSDLIDMISDDFEDFGINHLRAVSMMERVIEGSDDEMKEIEYVTPKLVRELLQNRYGNGSSEIQEQLFSRIEGKQISKFQMLQYLNRYKCINKALQNIEQLTSEKIKIINDYKVIFDKEEMIDDFIRKKSLSDLFPELWIKKLRCDEDIKAIGELSQVDMDELIQYLGIEDKNSDIIKLKRFLHLLGKMRKRSQKLKREMKTIMDDSDDEYDSDDDDDDEDDEIDEDI